MGKAMIAQLFDMMVLILVGKFVLNDVLHAVGFIPRKLTPYHMRCPRQEPHKCRHEYVVELYTEPYEWETCPKCGYGGLFTQFVQAAEEYIST